MVDRHVAPGRAELAEPALRARSILVIEDEPQIRRAIRNALQGVAERVLEAGAGSEGIDLAAAERPELVVLDLGLPDVAGLDVCLEIRRWANMPIVVLSARHAEHEKVLLLNAGADDYVTKPFSPRELAARVRAQLRRGLAATPAESTVTAGDLTIDLARRSVKRAGRPIHLTPIEWDILRTLVGQAGRTLTHQQIFDAVWRRQFGNPQQYLRVYITTLRRKIEVDPTHPQLIITEPGVGYRIELPH
jgi:two-component system, OmpR family, KDP operon response regulator KdpE